MDFPPQCGAGPPASPYQEKVALHGADAAEGDLEDRALAQEGVGGVYYVVLQAQALVHFPQFLQPLLGTGGAPSAEARQGLPASGRFALCGQGQGVRGRWARCREEGSGDVGYML